MATLPIIKHKSNERPSSMKSMDKRNTKKLEKKLTVLESHGYALGKTIGTGSYATVKVNIYFMLHFISFAYKFLE